MPDTINNRTWWKKETDLYYYRKILYEVININSLEGNITNINGSSIVLLKGNCSIFGGSSSNYEELEITDLDKVTSNLVNVNSFRLLSISTETIAFLDSFSIEFPVLKNPYGYISKINNIINTITKYFIIQMETLVRDIKIIEIRIRRSNDRIEIFFSKQIHQNQRYGYCQAISVSDYTNLSLHPILINENEDKVIFVIKDYVEKLNLLLRD